MKTKEQLCKELNDIINDAAYKTYHLLADNNIHIARNPTEVARLIACKAPDDRSTAMPLSSHYMFNRFEMLAVLFRYRFSARLDFHENPCKISYIYTDDEIQHAYDLQHENEVKLRNSDEYKQYLELKAKFEPLLDDDKRNKIGRGRIS